MTWHFFEHSERTNTWKCAAFYDYISHIITYITHITYHYISLITYHYISLHTSHTHFIHYISLHMRVCESYARFFVSQSSATLRETVEPQFRHCAEAPGLSALARNHRSPGSQVALPSRVAGQFSRETMGKPYRNHWENGAETPWNMVILVVPMVVLMVKHGETHHFHHPKDLPQTPANDHPPCRVSAGILVSGDFLHRTMATSLGKNVEIYMGVS